jgi:hypothetical protein
MARKRANAASVAQRAKAADGEKKIDLRKAYAISHGMPGIHYLQDGKYYSRAGDFVEMAGAGFQPKKIPDRRAAAPRLVIAPKNAREEALSKLGSFDTIPAKVRDARAENARAIAAEANADK